MSRSVFRFIPHTIQHAPDMLCTREASCTTCKLSSGTGDEDSVQLWCLGHAGLNPTHTTYRRVVVDHARVTREA